MKIRTTLITLIGSLFLYACPTQDNAPQPQNQPQEDKAQQLAKVLQGTWGRENTYNTTFPTTVSNETVKATCTEKDQWTIRWGGGNNISVKISNTHNCGNYVNSAVNCPIGSTAPCTPVAIKGKLPTNPVWLGSGDGGTFKIDQEGNINGIFYVRVNYTYYTGVKDGDEIEISKAQLQLAGNNTLNVVDRQASKVLIQLKRE
jgi:hypothetical protein